MLCVEWKWFFLLNWINVILYFIYLYMKWLPYCVYSKFHKTCAKKRIFFSINAHAHFLAVRKLNIFHLYINLHIYTYFFKNIFTSLWIAYICMYLCMYFMLSVLNIVRIYTNIHIRNCLLCGERRAVAVSSRLNRARNAQTYKLKHKIPVRVCV